jgi:PDZ domain-containing protein
MTAAGAASRTTSASLIRATHRYVPTLAPGHEKAGTRRWPEQPTRGFGRIGGDPDWMDRPPPPLPPEPPRPRRWWRLVAAVAAAGIALGLVGALVQIPYYTLAPGPAREVAGLVHVSGQRVYPSDGSFLLTTVSVSTRPVTLFEALVGWLDPAVDVVERSVIVQPGLSDAQQDQLNALDMEQSKYAAVIAALHAVGIEAPPLPGARVVAVAAGFPAEGKLAAGDVILAVDGARVRSPEDAVRAIEARPPGAELRIDVRRGEDRLALSVRTVRSPLTADRGRPVIGAALAPAFAVPFGVTVDSGNIGGPSAGLAFALAIADALTPEDLTRGHRIAVTGTITASGVVGPVGGVAFKVRAAEREGADVFLVPRDEAGEARAAAGRALRVIGISSLEEAIARLRTLDRRAPVRAAA